MNKPKDVFSEARVLLRRIRRIDRAADERRKKVLEGASPHARAMVEALHKLPIDCDQVLEGEDFERANRYAHAELVAEFSERTSLIQNLGRCYLYQTARLAELERENAELRMACEECSTWKLTHIMGGSKTVTGFAWMNEEERLGWECEPTNAAARLLAPPKETP